MKHRLFAAIDLPTSTINEIEKLQRDMDKFGWKIEWQNPNKFHIRLVYMGRLDDENENRVRGITKNTARIFRPFTVQLLAVQALYKRHDPSEIFLPVRNEDGILADLQKEIARRVDEVTPQPRHKFLPQVLIGEILKSDPTRVKQTLDGIDNIETKPLEEFEVTEISLYELFPSKAGDSYSKIGAFKLGE